MLKKEDKNNLCRVECTAAAGSWQVILVLDGTDDGKCLN